MKHDDPTQPRRDNKSKQRQWAHAPYNFVPLPDRVVYARPPLDHDHWDEMEGNSCWIDCTLETQSPTYIRGMLTALQHKQLGDKKAKERTVQDKINQSAFFATDNQKVGNALSPVIPGASLRGMLRSVVEIIGHGHMRWVGSEPTFTFRAVAASKDDPLQQPYRDVIGAFSRNVRAGYLMREGEKWLIKPALTPSNINLPSSENWLKVKETSIGTSDLPGFIRFNDDNYRPQLHRVTFNTEIRRGRLGSHVSISQIGPTKARYPQMGILVCVGNMLETASDDTKKRTQNQESPRKNHTLVLPPNFHAKSLEIEEQAIRDYTNGLTPFQRDKLEAWGNGDGCLPSASDLDLKKGGKAVMFKSRENAQVFGPPVFFVHENDGRIRYFGHSPNFRIPMRLPDTDRAATPLDFVPERVLDGERPDLAEAIFGWVEEDGRPNLEGQRAGRVYVGDARLISTTDNPWYDQNPIALKPLASPKATTFQHYLVQNRGKGHSPDDKRSLAHYGSRPRNTEIRGHKLYWHRGRNSQIKAARDTLKQHESQLTRVRPVKSGVTFGFRIHFQNLRDEELGALLWALTLPVNDGNQYCHKIGMGKPLGMGSVSIKSKLTLIDRQSRYEQLFDGNNWHAASSEKSVNHYIQAFERYMKQELGIEQSLAQTERMQAFLTMMQWREGNSAWTDATRYMEIERGTTKINEYAQRPVLPTPQEVAIQALQQSGSSGATRKTRPLVENIHKSVDYVTGRVKYFGKKSGRLIIDQTGEEIFVHRRHIRAGIEKLHEGQQVSFVIVQGMNGSEPSDVHLLS